MSELRNIADLVRRAAQRSPDKTALVSGEQRRTWAELDTAIDRVAAGLLADGLKPGERVGLLLPNGIPFAVGYFAIARAGLVALPLNTAYTEDELGYQLDDAQAALVIADPGLEQALGTRRRIVVGTEDWEQLFSPRDPVASTVGGEELAVLLYTSGTTGRPKGAMLSHRALLANLEQLSRISPEVIASDDVALLVLPLFHVYGLNAGLGMTAFAAATGVLVDRFDPVATLELVRAEQISNIIGAPPMYVAWSMLPELGSSLASLRLAVSGAAPLPPTVLSAVLEGSGHHIFEGYGLTETAPVLTTTLCSEVAKPGSIGRPIPGVALRLVDDVGDDADPDDPGEIVVRGPNTFSGYWPDGSGGPDSEGWFRTGDVAYADADGDLFLVDRVRELILVSGFNVYPREVEQVIATHPAVAEVAVLGVEHPYTGESVKALVVVEPGKTVSAEELIAHAARRLARFKCPTSVEFVETLPHSATGKVAKGKLREAGDDAA